MGVLPGNSDLIWLTVDWQKSIRTALTPTEHAMYRILFCWLVLGTPFALGCGDDESPSASRAIAGASVALPAGAGAALTAAAEDFSIAVEAIAGPASQGGIIAVDIGPDDALGAEGYRLTSTPAGMTVSATTEMGAAYGIYGLLEALGVGYHHPEETVYPSQAALELPLFDAPLVSVPSFSRRGFHEHTQHPIVMSDYYLRPDVADGRATLSRYIRWLVRNRQNAMSFHALNTLALETWLPYMAEVIEEANRYGVEVGIVLSFADQQQHNFKLIDLALDVPDETQIIEGIDSFLGAGFDFLTFQYGTSEFTTPPDGVAVNWLDTAVGHMATAYPETSAYAWIHISCDVETDAGERFFHEPLKADARLGAFVHTTMFYTLTDPAPVYECERFDHQLEFMDAAEGQREMVFFPETAWWLGFDNNLPLALPLTGLSRARDIERVMRDYTVAGHITFTSGREWGYWQYDHFLARATWNATLTWDDYLDQTAPFFGVGGEALTTALKRWTALQDEHIYRVNPHIYFYLAGELPQDEAGAQAGVIARPAKPPLVEVLGYDASTFDAWRTRDYALLETMLTAYQDIFETLPERTDGNGDSAIQARLYDEGRRTLSIYVQRIRHALAIYGGVIAVRDRDREAAEAALDQARAISAAVIEAVSAGEAHYRYPLALLAEDKPESKTAYPFGYLAETRTGFFWTRRDTQLARLIDDAFAADDEAWTTPPNRVFMAEGDAVSLTAPATPIADSVLGGFIPRLLFGALPPMGTTYSVTLAQDANGNDRPDADTELVLSADSLEPWVAPFDEYVVIARDTAGAEVGRLSIYAGRAEATPTLEDERIVKLGPLLLSGEISSQQIIDMVRAIAGIDEEGIATLLKSVFALDPADPLPARLPIAFEIDAEPYPPAP